MAIWTLQELMQLTRDELCDLATHIERALSKAEAGSVRRTNALASLENIRRVMVLRGFYH